jgi:hypothetical protein
LLECTSLFRAVFPLLLLVRLLCLLSLRHAHLDLLRPALLLMVVDDGLKKMPQ